MSLNALLDISPTLPFIFAYCFEIQWVWILSGFSQVQYQLELYFFVGKKGIG